jgi:hypothetical protein
LNWGVAGTPNFASEAEADGGGRTERKRDDRRCYAYSCEGRARAKRLGMDSSYLRYHYEQVHGKHAGGGARVAGDRR